MACEPLVDDVGCLGRGSRLLGLAVLGFGLELGNLDLDLLLDACLQLLAIAELEEDLEPDKHGGEEDGLDEIVEQGGRTALKGAMANELGDPRDDVDDEGELEGGLGVLEAHVIGEGGAADAEGGQDEAGDGLEQDVEPRVKQRGDGAEVEVEIRDGEPRGEVDQGSRICGLRQGLVVSRDDDRRAKRASEGEARRTMQKAETRMSGTQTM